MVEVSALTAGFQGIQQGLADAQSAAQRIADPKLDHGLDGLTEAAIELLQAQTQVEASAAVVESAQETIGTLIDVFA